MKILVIDDEKAIRDLLGRLFRAENFDVIFSEDGLDGLERAKQAAPDIILMDMEMPRMDGLSLCRLLKEDGRTAAIPILFVTSAGKIGSIEDALNAGASGYITKPFDLLRVSEKVKSILHQK